MNWNRFSKWMKERVQAYNETNDKENKKNVYSIYNCLIVGEEIWKNYLHIANKDYKSPPIFKKSNLFMIASKL